MTGQNQIYDIRSEGNFEKLFREFFAPLSFYARKMVHDEDTAKDIVHAVFIKLWELRNDLKLDTSLKSYLYRAVHNRSLNHLRNQSRFRSEEPGEYTEGTAEFNDDIIAAETEARIIMAIEGLPDRCAEVFRKSRFEDKKYREIAEEMKISVKTVEIQMSKALRILREELKDLLFLLLMFLYNFFK